MSESQGIELRPAEVKAAKTIPVVEIFGPTLQGEGALAGRPTYFLRVGGCDYACVWCDSSHAVIPDVVRGYPRLTEDEINEQLDRQATQHPGPDWLTISGGNPALFELDHVVRYWKRPVALSGRPRMVAVETQGSRWKPWLADVNLLTVSPKPPSSGMFSAKRQEDFHEFVWQSADAEDRNHPMALESERWKMVFKVVVFDEEDYRFARDLHIRYPLIPFYLSCGTAMGGLSGKWVPPQGVQPDVRPLYQVSNLLDSPKSLLARYRWLAERMMGDPVMSNVAGFPQLHALTWGIDTKGV